MTVMSTGIIRFAIHSDAIIRCPSVVQLPTADLPRRRVTLTDRPAMRRVEATRSGRAIRRARERLTAQDVTAAQAAWSARRAELLAPMPRPRSALRDAGRNALLCLASLLVLLFLATCL